MSFDVLKAFHAYYKEIKNNNRQFASKAKKVESLKDSYYTYALSLWNRKDELLKNELALEINSWIDDIQEVAEEMKKKALLHVLYILSQIELSEGATDYALALTAIRGGIDDKEIDRKSAFGRVLENIVDGRNLTRRYFARRTKAKHLAAAIDNIFNKLIDRVKKEENLYIALVDGAYWNDIMETVKSLDSPPSAHFAETVTQCHAAGDISIPKEYADRMEYVKSVLSGLYKECTFFFLAQQKTTFTADRFGSGFAQYVECIIYITRAQMLMPSWVTFQNYQAKFKTSAFDKIFNTCASSPLYWFCSLLLEIDKFFKKHKSTNKREDVYEIIALGVSGCQSGSPHAIKYINCNMPTDTDETKLLKNEVQLLLEKKMLFEAAFEYAYYLSCLYEPYGVTEKRRSWHRKNVDTILSSYKQFLDVLRRVFIAIERRKRSKSSQEVYFDEITPQKQKSKEADGQKDEKKTGDVAQDLSVAESSEESVREWRCLDRNISIQIDSNNFEKFIDISRDTALNQIWQYLIKNRLDSLISPEYILTTLDNYLEIEDSYHRGPVWIDDVLWIKIRKGKVRLLVRPVDDGLIFNVYKRKEYAHGMFD